MSRLNFRFGQLGWMKNSIESFVNTHADVRPPAAIVERWESRIVAQGLHVAGRRGAETYLGLYGKGLGASKAVAFARCAEIKGFPLVAARFWEEAFFLATGERGSLSGQSATPAAVSLPSVALSAAFGRTPQLPAKTTPAEIERLLNDDRYGMQEKIDGRNVMVDVVGGRVAAGNKKGLAAAIDLGAADAAAAVSNDWKFDAENVAGRLHLFDLVEFQGQDLRSLNYADRHARLAEIQNRLPKNGALLRVVDLVCGRAAKLAFREELRTRGAEGFVLKLLSATYESGSGHECQFKSQFRERGTFISGRQNGVKSSVAISVYRADGTLRSMGNLTVPEVFPSGTIFEVEYLYCHGGSDGKLHQPVFIETRSDATAEDCQEAKLKVKPKGIGDDED